MIDERISFLIIVLIYILLIANISIIITIIILNITDKVLSFLYGISLKRIGPLVGLYAKDKISKSDLNSRIKNKIDKKVIEEMLLEIALKENKDLSRKFEELGLVSKYLKKAKASNDFRTIKALGTMRSNKALDFLMKATKSKRIEIRYLSCHSLVLLKLDESEKKQIIKNILNSGILRERIIEILRVLNLDVAEIIGYLENTDKAEPKVIFLNLLRYKNEIKDQVYSDKVTKYLNDKSMEVRIAAVLTIAVSKQEKYFNILKILYKNEEKWQVRAAIAKSINSFKNKEALDVLKEMVYDEAWWVRYNSFASISKMGKRGVETLIDLSLDNKNEAIASQAYHLLDSDSYVYKSIKDS